MSSLPHQIHCGRCEPSAIRSAVCKLIGHDLGSPRPVFDQSCRAISRPILLSPHGTAPSRTSELGEPSIGKPNGSGERGWRGGMPNLHYQRKLANRQSTPPPLTHQRANRPIRRRASPAPRATLRVDLELRPNATDEPWQRPAFCPRADRLHTLPHHPP